MTIDVIVPVYGNWAVTESCLRHLERQTAPHRVILVDDGSRDNTIEMVKSEFPSVDILEMKTNSGFSKACNKGIWHGDADVVVLLNNDVEADATMLERLAEPFLVDATIGSTVPLLLQPDGLVDAFGISADSTLAGFTRYHGARIGDVSSESPSILGPYGAAAAYRRKALDEVGALDEAIFMYGEELDLALRLRSAGWRLAAVPGARGVHAGAASIGKNSPRQRYLAGFGRGYLLRVYGVLLSRYWLRALVTETTVGIVRIVVSRDLASLKGRVEGWKAGGSVDRRGRPNEGVDLSITFLMSLRMRSPLFWNKNYRKA